jgi:UDP-glucose 4-epimerase
VKVLVTGGAGFIGRHLVADLVEDGHEVAVLDNLQRGERETVERVAAQFVMGDVRDRAAVVYAAHDVQVIYHLAAQSNVLGAVSDIDYSFTTNVVGTFNVLTVARDLGVERVVFTSSREVYGEVDRLPITEDDALNPKNAYGASKVAGELYSRTFGATYNLDVSILRLSNVYGPGDADRVIPIWLERARQGLNLELYGGDQILDFVPVSVVIRALRRAAATSLQQQPVNVGSGTSITLRELARHIQELFGVAVNLCVLPARSAEVTRFVADVSRMRTILGIQPPADPFGELRLLLESTHIT